VNATAFVPDYRLAPEHPFPSALEDATAVYQGFVDQGIRRIVIVGDSAGGGLSLVLRSIVQSEAVAGRGLAPSAAVVMSPWTGLPLTGESLRDRLHPETFRQGPRMSQVEIAADELTMTEVAAAFGAATGRQVSYQRQPLSELEVRSAETAKMFGWFEAGG